MNFPEKFLDLLNEESKALLYLATLMTDGSPQVTPVWFDTDGEHILINTNEGRVKDKNMKARPRVAMTIQDPKDPNRYLGIRGEVVSYTTEGADEHINKLSLKYDDKPWNIATDKSGSSSRSNQIISTNTIDLHNFLRTRRSIRRFKPDPIADSVIENILTAAAFAPSAHNRQPWRFVVVTDLSVKEKLAEAMAVDFQRDLTRDGLSPEKIQSQIKRSKERITSAPVAILLCLDMSEMDSYPDEKRSRAEYIMAVQSVAAAGLQLLLATHAEGLGGVWACWPLFAQETIQKTLNLSESWEPQGMFFIGYPIDIPEARERKPLQEIMVVE